MSLNQSLNELRLFNQSKMSELRKLELELRKLELELRKLELELRKLKLGLRRLVQGDRSPSIPRKPEDNLIDLNPRL